MREKLAAQHLYKLEDAPAGRLFLPAAYKKEDFTWK